ncbi:MAG: hypothetical protein KC731_29465 [Myxococcales bacterium]|nr:hypothetical protein [Myxococcales bacterium]
MASRAAGLSIALLASGCTAVSTADRALAIAEAEPLACAATAELVTRRGEGEVVRGCMIDGVWQGSTLRVELAEAEPASPPNGKVVEQRSVTHAHYVDGQPRGWFRTRSTTVLDDGRRDVWLSDTLRDGEAVRAETDFHLEGGQWRRRRAFRTDDRGILELVEGEAEGWRLTAEMPGGTGPFRLVDEAGTVRAEGGCRDGLRQGTWIERNARGEVLRLRSYRDGLLHGPQRWGERGGEARGGRRIGAWTERFEEVCVEEGPQGSKCGFIPCLRRRPGGLAHLEYDEAGRATVTAIDWASDPGPDAGMPPSFDSPPPEVATCRSLEGLLYPVSGDRSILD